MARSKAGQVCAEYCAKFTKTSTHTLASKLLREQSSLFTSKEQARSLVRYYRGEMGKKNRKKVDPEAKTTKHVIVPESDAKPVKPHVLTATGKGLICGDIHMPYHDKPVLDLMFNWAIQQERTDFLILNGDIMDCYRMSRWVKDPRMRDFASELEMTQNFLRSLVSVFGAVYYKCGNHEVRYWDYMRLKAPELVGVEALSFERLLELEEIGIRYIAPTQVIHASNLTILHGHEWGRSIFSPVNPARGAFLRAHACTVSGHLHRGSHHPEPDIRGRVMSCWSHGCLCELHPEYAPLNKWDQSWLSFDFDGDWFELGLRKAINGRVA